ncbi:MAG: ammonium transporter [Gemmatimonadota bacterium]|nr:ammonium transporter [Gemmatimonadota bacterium]
MNTAEISAGDTAWVMISAALVMLMIPGLAFFYGGLVRRKSSLNTLMMSVAALGVISVQWVVIGYSLAFSPGSPIIGGAQWAGFSVVGANANLTYAATIPHLAFAAFQMMFAAITIALVSGAVVERMKFSAYLLFAVLWSTLIYDPLAHWVWGDGGWLHTLGALDFAGGTVVHISAGISALVAAIMLGKRRDFGRAPLVPHNVPFTVLGAGLLWFGWFGFNAGSALAANGVAANAFVTTHIAAASALTMWMVLDLFRNRHCTAVGAATGAVVGLVAITPAAGFVTPSAAIAIGVIAASASFFAMQMRSRTQLDDALDVFACHGVAGIVGALLTGVFATKGVNAGGGDGLLAGNAHQLLVQLYAVLATIVLAGVGTVILLSVVKLFGGLRISLADEIAGIDVAEHGEQAYHGGDLDELAGGLGDSIVLSHAGEDERTAA